VTGAFREKVFCTLSITLFSIYAMSDNDESSEDEGLDLFKEPEGYYPPEKQHTVVTHTALDGQTLTLRLVGHNPLWVGFAFSFLAMTHVQSFTISQLSWKVHQLHIREHNNVISPARPSKIMI
jgi:hypothetical protein